MVCQNCHKPYAFLEYTKTDYIVCSVCGHKDTYTPPPYTLYLAEKYGHNYTRTIRTDPQMRYIINTLSIKPRDIVLDIGCGVGDYTYEIQKKTKTCMGIDLDIRSAQEKYRNVQFQQRDLNKPFPFEDNTVDTIISINVIEHLIDHLSFLSECKRVLKKDGMIAITTANLDFILHDYFFDTTHLHEWTLPEFTSMICNYFQIIVAKKSSSMFNYYPFNKVTTLFLKPDLIIVGKK